MKINIIDPGLFHQAGHHLDLDIKVCKVLKNLGHDIAIYSSINVTDKIKSFFEHYGEVTPIFKAIPYFNVENIDRLAGGYIAFNRQSKILAEDFTKVASADLWLFPSIFCAQLNACAISGSKTPIAGCIHLSATKEYAQDEMFWRYALINCKDRSIELNLGVMEPEHLMEYQKIASNDFEIISFPIPYEGVPIERPRKTLRKVGFFGHQRDEKGIHLVAKLTDLLTKKGYEIVIQDSTESFKSTGYSNVTILGYVANIALEISKCDCVILPYNPIKYQTKGSGILWDALASGVPVIAPVGTAIGRWIQYCGSGRLFHEFDVNSIIHQFELLSENYDEYVSIAIKNASIWSVKHGIDKFVSSLLNFKKSC
uniref:Glycosyltransferase n=1 Tax=Chlorobium chlorochromatii (strain CaD3) TaxID=340177 RepID=Q3ASK5_CHLCH